MPCAVSPVACAAGSDLKVLTETNKDDTVLFQGFSGVKFQRKEEANMRDTNGSGWAGTGWNGAASGTNGSNQNGHNWGGGLK